MFMKDNISQQNKNSRIKLLSGEFLLVQVKKVLISKQVAQGGALSAVKGMADLKGSMQTLEGAGLAQNILWQGSLNQVWGLINMIQITIHIQLINAEIPQNL